jgi:hypothetical protein
MLPNNIRLVKSRKMRWKRHVARTDRKGMHIGYFVEKLEGKRPLGRTRRSWIDNIETDLGKMRWDGMDWIDLFQDRDQCRALVNIVMNFKVP